MANKRIWSEILYWSLGVSDASGGVFVVAADAYLAQEDLDLVGYWLEAKCRAANDITVAELRHLEFFAEISQHPQRESPGTIGRVSLPIVAFTDTGVVRAPMYLPLLKDAFGSFFPGGTAFSIKEGETLALHIYYNNSLGGIVTLEAKATLYFTKKK